MPALCRACGFVGPLVCASCGKTESVCQCGHWRPSCARCGKENPKEA